MVGFDLISDIVKTVGKVIPDKDKQNEIQVELTRAINSGEIELEKLKVKSQEIETNSRMKLIESMPVPLIMYTFLLIVINNSIIAPYLSLFLDVKIPILEIDNNLYDLIAWLFGSVMVKKGAEKFAIRKWYLNGTVWDN